MRDKGRGESAGCGGRAGWLLALMVMLALGSSGCGAQASHFKGSASAVTQEDATTLTVPVPAESGPGDLLIAVIVTDSIPNIRFPSGWQLLSKGDCLEDACEIRSFWRIADGSEESVSFRWHRFKEQAAGGVLAYGSNGQRYPFGIGRRGFGLDDSPTAPRGEDVGSGLLVLRIMAAADARRSLQHPPGEVRLAVQSRPPDAPDASEGVILGLVEHPHRGPQGIPEAVWRMDLSAPWRTLTIPILPRAGRFF